MDQDARHERIAVPEGTKPDEWLVYDTNARSDTSPRRHHLIVDEKLPTGGVRKIPKAYEFFRHRATPVPKEAALRLIERDIPTFRVYDNTGRRVLKRRETSALGKEVELGPREVIAAIEELTRESLIARCQELPGGPDLIRKRPTKDELIDFYLVGGNPMAGALRDVGEAREDDLEMFDPDPMTDPDDLPGKAA